MFELESRNQIVDRHLTHQSNRRVGYMQPSPKYLKMKTILEINRTTSMWSEFDLKLLPIVVAI